MTVPRIIPAGVIAIALVGLGVSGVAAGPAPNIGPHRHFLVTPQGEVPVGPDICGNADLQKAFNQFHHSVHVGPANTAFDHGHNPVDIKGGAC